MRDIIFRGQWTANHAWQFGYLISDFRASANFSIVNETGKYRVAHKTISQYTGLHDERGGAIFEGDILDVYDRLNLRAFIGYVAYKDGSFVICEGDFTHYRWMDYETTLIGNKWDNPELLEATP